MKIWIWCGLMILVTIPFTNAGTAALHPNGKSLLRIVDNSLRIEDTEKPGEFLTIQLPKIEGVLTGVSVRDQEIFIAMANSIFVSRVRQPKQSWSLIWQSQQQGELVSELCVDPKSGMLLWTVNQESGDSVWLAMLPDEQKAYEVKRRRAQDAQSAVFDHVGQIYFICSGDLWKGVIEWETDNEGNKYCILNGERILPIAELETSEGTSSSTGANAVVPLSKFLIVDRSRLGGSGWGNIVRVANTNFYSETPKKIMEWELLLENDLGMSSILSPDGKKAWIYPNNIGRWYSVDVETGGIKLLGPEASVPK